MQTAVIKFFALIVAMVATAAVVNVGCLAAPSTAEEAEQLLSRQRRRVDQMGAMVTATTGRHFSDFLGYGSFCGFHGSGEPVDSLDACCQAHDRCYGVMQTENETGNCTATDGDGDGETPIFNIYLSRYNYSIGTGGVIECLNPNTSDSVVGSDNSSSISDISSSNSSSSNSTTERPESVTTSKPIVGGGGGRYPVCQRRLCECDKALAQCLKRHIGQYNATHLSEAQAVLRRMIKMAEKYPDTYDAAWNAVAKLMEEKVTAAPADDGSNLNGAAGTAGNGRWLLALLVLPLLASRQWAE